MRNPDSPVDQENILEATDEQVCEDSNKPLAASTASASVFWTQNNR